MAHLQLSEGTIPSTPAAGKRIIFASSDGVYGLDSAGGTTLFGAGGGGGGGIAAAAGTQTATTGTVVFSNSNNFTFGMSGSTRITASFSESTHSHSTAPSAVAAGTQTGTSGTIVFANSNGLTFGMSGSSQITASHNGLTTARASNDAIGLGTAQSNVTWTVNSAGLSLDARGYAGTVSSFGGTNISGSMTLNSGGLTLSLSGGAGGGGGGIAASAGTQLATSGTVVFANSNNFTFGMSGSSQITASFSESTHSHATFVGGLAAGTQTATSGTVAFVDSNGITFGMSASTRITASHNGLTSQSNQALSGSNGSFTFQTATFGALNGLTFYTSNGSLVGSHNALTTARASTDAIGLATARTNVTWTVNSAGLSLNAAGYAGTGTTFAGANLSGSMTLNSAGLNLSMSAAVPGGGGAVNFSAGTTSNNLQTLVFSNSNGVSFGLNGSTITASAAGGGAAVTVGGAELFPLNNATAFSTLGQNSIYFQKFICQSNVSFNNLEHRFSVSTVSSTNSQRAAHTYDYGLYLRDTGASSTQYTLMASSRMVLEASFSSNVSAAYTVSQGGASFTTSSAGTAVLSALSGFKHLYFPFTSTLTEGGQYAIALRMSSATTVGTSPLRLGIKQMTNYSNLSVGKIGTGGASVSNASNVGDFAMGVWSATSSNLPNTLQLSGFTNAISQARMYLQFDA